MIIIIIILIATLKEILHINKDVYNKEDLENNNNNKNENKTGTRETWISKHEKKINKNGNCNLCLEK